MSNLNAFLAMIGTSEGTRAIPDSDDGYRVIVGSTTAKPLLMDNYADHPRIKVHVRPDLVSSAAGRYQILERYYDAYKAKLGLKDFSPASQDAIAIQMIREKGAFADVASGRFDEAVAKCSGLWASLPGNSYGQRQNALAYLRQAFTDAGGIFA